MSNRFDQKARELDKHPVIREIALKFSQTLKINVPVSGDSQILDYGCGSGLVGMHLYQDVYSIMMMDSSEGMLDLLKEKIERHNISNMTVSNCDLHDASAEAQQFDVIYMNNVLHCYRRLNIDPPTAGFLTHPSVSR